MLSEEERERIRFEEIFREEVRHDLENKSQSPIMKFLNSPFGLYLLSTVLVGVISFSYTRWKEHNDTAQAHHLQLDKLRDEMAFRIRQLDFALEAADQQILLAESAKEPSPDEFLRSKKTLNIAMQAVPVVVRLGGLAQIPGDLTMGSWIRFRDIDVQPNLLPFNQGYKSKEYAFETLTDLSLDIERIEGKAFSATGKDELQRNLDALEEPAYKFVHFATFRASTEYPIEGQPITSIHDLARQYQVLLRPIVDGWSKAKGSELVRKNITE